MYPIQSGQSFMVQQSVSGVGGTFSGAEYGRAKGRFPLGAAPGANTVVCVSAKLYGVASNVYTLSMFDNGAGTNVLATTVQLLGNEARVTLRRTSGGGIQATAAEVATAINSANLPIAAWYEGNGNGVVAAQSALPIGNLAQGFNASLRGPNANQFIWSLPATTPGGFFYFENQEPIMVFQFESLFNSVGVGPETVTVSRANLNPNLEVIAGETIPVFVWNNLTTSRPDISFSDVGIILQPQQALLVAVTNNLTGVARFDLRKTAGYPYP